MSLVSACGPVIHWKPVHRYHLTLTKWMLESSSGSSDPEKRKDKDDGWMDRNTSCELVLFEHNPSPDLQLVGKHSQRFRVEWKYSLCQKLMLIDCFVSTQLWCRLLSPQATQIKRVLIKPLEVHVDFLSHILTFTCAADALALSWTIPSSGLCVSHTCPDYSVGLYIPSCSSSSSLQVVWDIVDLDSSPKLCSTDVTGQISVTPANIFKLLPSGCRGHWAVLEMIALTVSDANHFWKGDSTFGCYLLSERKKIPTSLTLGHFDL